MTTMTEAVAYSRKNPFPAPLLGGRLLTARGSGKETWHFELSLEGSGLRYETGDSLGIFPTNSPAAVNAFLGHLDLAAEAPLALDGAGEGTLRDALMRHWTLREPSKQLLAAIVEREPAAAHLAELLAPEQRGKFDAWLAHRDVMDVLHEFPGVRFEPHELPKVLRKLQPRLYSIASSLRAHPDEVHLTVAIVRYQAGGRDREGVCSTFLADRVKIGETVPVFIHTAKHFRLPEDAAAPVIMIGPGTGIAPFRAFLEERRATGAPGRNWLFFGERNRSTDFFYEEEFAAMQAEGVLHRFDTAFSRDQEHKVYVQHRILDHAGELWKWLEEGAYVYVCGDANRMAKDVDTALHQVVERAAGRTPHEAAAYIDHLRHTKRYRRDVY